MNHNSWQLNEKCAVFGVYGPKLEVARLAYYGLYALQHRGQESSGIVSTDGKRLYSHVGSGLVAHVYREDDLSTLYGHMAIGHNRYSTSGGNKEHHQPIIVEEALAFAHNGNLPSTHALERFLDERGIEHGLSNDSEMMAAALAHFVAAGLSLSQAVERCYPLFTGAFACVAMDKNSVVAFRDPKGLRPLVLGTLDGGYAVASETCAFDTIGAAFLRDVAPGEMVVLDSFGLRSISLADDQEKLDIFEYVYFARPDSILGGQRVGEVRRRFGARLAVEHQIKADVVIPVPDSAIPAAMGFAQASAIPFELGLIKNRYIHRTFIRPTPQLRDHDLRMKLNPIPESLMGRHVAVVDDSIVRGNTTKKIVNMLYGAGARTVNVLISSPPVKYPDFYGIDTPRQQELIAATMSIKKTAAHIGCDYLGYLSYNGMIEATGRPASSFSTACFNGVYPIDIHERVNEITSVP